MVASSTETLLSGWTVTHAPGCAAPVAVAVAWLEQFGARAVDVDTDPAALRLHNDEERGWPTARLNGWRGERALPRRPGAGAVLTAYAGLRLAGAAALAARRGIEARLPARRLVAGVSVPLALRSGREPELVRCRDGWMVVRWREDAEPVLLRALVGHVEECDRDDVVAAARLARILAAPVVAPRPGPARPVEARLDGLPARVGPRPRVLDWSVLWAGPWATAQLRRGGATVERVEHPRRRDGLLGFAAGRRCWTALNGGKRMRLLDARRPADHHALERALRGADIAVTSMTPRALRGLGFDDAWRLEHAPQLLHLELVAFDDPWVDAPGLGEHAAAQAGLLWRGPGARPAAPEPWADPLLGAAALAVARIWQASGQRRGGRIRLSLERAAALALEVDGIAPEDRQSGIE